MKPKPHSSVKRNVITLEKLKEEIDRAIQKYGGDKKVRLFNQSGYEKELKINSFSSHDKGNWIELTNLY